MVKLLDKNNFKEVFIFTNLKDLIINFEKGCIFGIHIKKLSLLKLSYVISMNDNKLMTLAEWLPSKVICGEKTILNILDIIDDHVLM